MRSRAIRDGALSSGIEGKGRGGGGQRDGLGGPGLGAGGWGRGAGKNSKEKGRPNATGQGPRKFKREAQTCSALD